MTLDEKIGQMLMPGFQVGAFRNFDSPNFRKFGVTSWSITLAACTSSAAIPPSSRCSSTRCSGSRVPLLVGDNFEEGAGYWLFGDAIAARDVDRRDRR
jgi:hypothetical protein